MTVVIFKFARHKAILIILKPINAYPMGHLSGGGERRGRERGRAGNRCRRGGGRQGMEIGRGAGGVRWTGVEGDCNVQTSRTGY